MDVSLRPATDADEPFLRQVYGASRYDVDRAQWDDEQKRQFLDMQYRLQAADYTARFPDAELAVVVGDGDDVGRLWVDRSGHEIRVLDLALLPEYRNRGVGTLLLERLIAEARDDGLPVRYAVVKDNLAALRLYERLGFAVIEDAGSYLLMEWSQAPG